MTRLVSLPVLILACVLAPNALAEPKDDVAAAAAKWTEIFAQNNPDTISALYAKEGVLWGTLSPTVRSDAGAVKAYFVGAFNALPRRWVERYGWHLLAFCRK